jgi:hypothetical protein
VLGLQSCTAMPGSFIMSAWWKHSKSFLPAFWNIQCSVVIYSHPTVKSHNRNFIYFLSLPSNSSWTIYSFTCTTTLMVYKVQPDSQQSQQTLTERWGKPGSILSSDAEDIWAPPLFDNLNNINVLKALKQW